MIERMTKYSWVLLSSGKEAFLENLRELGVVDITRSSKPVDKRSASMLEAIEQKRELVRCLEKGEDAHLIELRSELSALKAQLRDTAPWGNYDKEKLSVFGVHYYCVPEKKFVPSLAEEYPLMEVCRQDGKVWFVVLGDNLPSAFKELPAPSLSLSQLEERISAKAAEIEAWSASLLKRKEEIPSIEQSIAKESSDLSLYLASLEGSSAADESLCIYEGFAPSECDGSLRKAFDEMDGVLCLSQEAASKDNPPIKLRNNKFVKMFEVLTDMYGRPSYDSFDPTVFISIFFLLFFAMCMGDAGYGIVLVIAGLLLKKIPSFRSMAPLVSTLGVATIVVGFVFHTFFSVDFSTWECIPGWMHKLFVPAKIAGFDGTMIVAILVGIVHLCLAMLVKTWNATRNKGFLESLSVWGWTLLIVGGVAVGALALAGAISSQVTKIVIIVIGCLSALGIFLFNNIHRNPLINIGSGLWETYNTATGLLGDVLSYLRLYALGLAGAMLGFAFNNLAVMALGDGAVLNWIFFVLIVVVGHTLNLAMAALGAFVHPLRLNFLEFFKNSGYEANGKKYNPLTK
ncbi:MAG: V-type ATPase 116kDa subunit family protein [Candidatus Cryptobacteroides sp.]|nr:V-type ATPase 116kDa subunit family protein [Candidatus Cryptobacteroides sp.]